MGASVETDSSVVELMSATVERAL